MDVSVNGKVLMSSANRERRVSRSTAGEREKDEEKKKESKSARLQDNKGAKQPKSKGAEG